MRRLHLVFLSQKNKSFFSSLYDHFCSIILWIIHIEVFQCLSVHAYGNGYRNIVVSIQYFCDISTLKWQFSWKEHRHWIDAHFVLHFSVAQANFTGNTLRIAELFPCMSEKCLLSRFDNRETVNYSLYLCNKIALIFCVNHAKLFVCDNTVCAFFHGCWHSLLGTQVAFISRLAIKSIIV